MAYTKGLHEIGDGLFAYLQPDGANIYAELEGIEPPDALTAFQRMAELSSLG